MPTSQPAIGCCGEQSTIDDGEAAVTAALTLQPLTTCCGDKPDSSLQPAIGGDKPDFSPQPAIGGGEQPAAGGSNETAAVVCAGGLAATGGSAADPTAQAVACCGETATVFPQLPAACCDNKTAAASPQPPTTCCDDEPPAGRPQPRSASCCTPQSRPDDTLEQVREYYGLTLTGSGDLQTSACCGAEPLPAHVQAVLPLIAHEVTERFYGCGSPLPELLEGCILLDLGCGSGRDSFLAARLVGERGLVIGVDMTPEQIAVARRHEVAQAERFGFARPNTRFLKGYIEDLSALNIADASVDVIISNCALNLSPDKERVFHEMYRVLKPGGELYFSDVFASRRLPAELRRDPVLRGECLGGALYVEDFRRLMARVGWPDFRIVSSRPLAINNDEIAAKVGAAGFVSRTVRAFKLSALEDASEDYGQTACYLGTIPGHPERFSLDRHHRLATGQRLPVCGNTAAMLGETRFSPHFRIKGNRGVHFGRFVAH